MSMRLKTGIIVPHGRRLWGVSVHLVEVAEFPKQDEEFLVEGDLLGGVGQVGLHQRVVEEPAHTFQDEAQVLKDKLKKKNLTARCSSGNESRLLTSSRWILDRKLTNWFSGPPNCRARGCQNLHSVFPIGKKKIKHNFGCVGKSFTDS